MKKEKILCFTLLFSLILIMQSNVVLAGETTITIPMIKDYNMSVVFNVNDPLEAITIETIRTYSNFEDNVVFTFSTDKSKVDFHVLAFLSGNIIKSKKFEGYSPGGSIKLDLLDIDPSYSTSSQTDATKNTQTITGSVVEDGNNTQNIANSNDSLIIDDNLNQTSDNGPLSNINWKKTGLWAGYILGGLIVLALLFFVIRFLIKKIRWKRDLRGDIQVDSSLGGSKHERKLSEEELDRELSDAERKIKEAENEIGSIKERRRQISQAQRRYEESRAELERLRTAEDSQDSQNSDSIQ
jgi:hypothetical protein